MRIAHFIATNFVGGPERQIIRHCGALTERGASTVAVSFAEAGGESFLSSMADRTVAQLALDPAPAATVANVFRLRRFLQAQAVDLVVAHGYKATILAALQQSVGGIPAVAFSRGWTAEDRRVRVYEWLDRRFLRLHRRVIAVSDSQRQKLLVSGVADARIRVVHNAYLTEGMPALRQPGQIPVPRILSAGRLSPEKGHRFLIDAIPAVLAQHPAARFLIAGDGPEAERLKLRSAELGIQQSVEFLGFVVDMEALYRQATHFVLPSLTEGLPNVLLESFYFGLPVVSTAVGGVPELVESGVSGQLCPAESSVALAAALIAMLDDEAFAERCAIAGRKTLIELFGIERQTERLLEVYREAIG